MAAKKPTRKDCARCRNNFYNGNRMGLHELDGVPTCWSLQDAEFVKARDVPANMRPPYTSIPLTKRPDCYKATGYVRVKVETLTKEGYWK
jgi:hypothetical protein